MNQYTIYCTPEQTMKALELGAPITATLNTFEPNLYEYLGAFFRIPTAERMIGWLEEQGFYFYIFKDYCWNGEVQYGNNWYYSIDDVNSRKEATLAAIDAALDYLIKNKK